MNLCKFTTIYKKLSKCSIKVMFLIRDRDRGNNKNKRISLLSG